jgi:hypothetical protein
MDPPYAPIAEAIRIWAAEPRDADWSAPDRADKRSRILKLLRPIMADLTANDGLNGMLANSGIKRIKGILLTEIKPSRS